MIKENRHALQEMTIFDEKYVAVINATYKAAQVNRHALNNLTNRVKTIYMISQAMQEVQVELNDLEHEVDRQHRLRDDLEGGRLTELLFPPSSFQELEAASDEEWLSSEWYYQWCRVTPLWTEKRQYGVTLPLVSVKSTQGYELRTFPVGVNQRLVQLEVAAFASLDRRTGEVSTPQRCVGKGPTVCDEGPISEECAVAVLAQGHIEEKCRVHTAPHAKMYYPLMASEVVLLLKGKTVLRERCQTSVKDQVVGKGTMKIRWSPGCRLVTPNLTITAPRAGRRVITKKWMIPPYELNLGAHLNGTMDNPHLPELMNLDLSSLHLNHLPDITWSTRTSATNIVILTWLSVLTLLLILCSLAKWFQDKKVPVENNPSLNVIPLQVKSESVNDNDNPNLDNNIELDANSVLVFGTSN
jgi:hypothetical protein